MDLLVTIHSLWRWAVLIAAVVALVAATAGWLGALPPLLAARRAGSLYALALSVQFLIGVVVWVGKGWYAAPGYFRFEHPTIMLLALAVAHGGMAWARRAGRSAPELAARNVAIATLVSLVLVIVGIPGVVRGM